MKKAIFICLFALIGVAQSTWATVERPADAGRYLYTSWQEDCHMTGVKHGLIDDGIT